MATLIENKLFDNIGEQPPAMGMEEYYTLVGAIDSLSIALTHGDGRAFIANAFSLQMLPGDAIIGVTEVEPEDVPDDAVSIIGHTDTAMVVSDVLGREVACNRTSISLKEGDVLYVAQLMGGRLPEGATTLPEGFSLKWLKVVVR